jgi:hypothetical protein
VVVEELLELEEELLEEELLELEEVVLAKLLLLELEEELELLVNKTSK